MKLAGPDNANLQLAKLMLAKLVAAKAAKAHPTGGGWSSSRRSATCAGCGQTWPRDPALEVACPTCKARVGAWCKSPSGHKAMRLHRDRDRAALDAGTLHLCPAAATADLDAAEARRTVLVDSEVLWVSMFLGEFRKTARADRAQRKLLAEAERELWRVDPSGATAATWAATHLRAKARAHADGTRALLERAAAELDQGMHRPVPPAGVPPVWNADRPDDPLMCSWCGTTKTKDTGRITLRGGYCPRCALRPR